MFDQYYTQPEIAKNCIDILKSAVRNYDEYELYLEPSAGTGNFLELLPEKNRLGIDIDPKHDQVVKQDFFEYSFPDKKTIVVGNPPFGKRSKLALDFFLKAAEHTNTIAFILPLQWNKWSIQSKIPADWNLIYSEKLPEESFLYNDKPYKVRCCFQIWTTLNYGFNLRIKEKPAIFHPDFKMYLYNNTKQAEKYFDYDWDIAIPRQGYADYSRRETKKENCEKTTQWIFIKANDNEVFERIMSIDFFQLSKKNISTPGWGKADLVEEYKRTVKNGNR